MGQSSTGVKRRRLKRDEITFEPEIKFTELWTREDSQKIRDSWNAEDEALIKASSCSERSLYHKSLVLYGAIPPDILQEIKVNTQKMKSFLRRTLFALSSAMSFAVRLSEIDKPEFLRYSLKYAFYLRAGEKNGWSRPDLREVSDTEAEFGQPDLPEHYSIDEE
jgi:hypothetical protein